jgi:plastocyanin
MSPTEPNNDSKENNNDDIILHVVTSDPVKGSHVSSFGKKTPLLLGLLLVFILGVGVLTINSGHKSSKSSGTASLLSVGAAKVSISSKEFIPSTIRVKVGQTVTWVNTDAAPHNVASDPYPTDNTLSGLNSKDNLTTANDSFSFIFDKAGTYTYHDDLNPYILEGTVIVK